MKYQLRFRGHARRDVDAAFNWYADIDDRVAHGFLRSLDAIVARIGEAPLAYQVWPGKAVRRVPHLRLFGVFGRFAAPTLRAAAACPSTIFGSKFYRATGPRALPKTNPGRVPRSVFAHPLGHPLATSLQLICHLLRNQCTGPLPRSVVVLVSHQRPIGACDMILRPEYKISSLAAMKALRLHPRRACRLLAGGCHRPRRPDPGDPTQACFLN